MNQQQKITPVTNGRDKMTFKEERDLKEKIIYKIIDKYNKLFQKENISTTRDSAIAGAVNEVFSQLRTKDMLK